MACAESFTEYLELSLKNSETAGVRAFMNATKLSLAQKILGSDGSSADGRNEQGRGGFCNERDATQMIDHQHLSKYTMGDRELEQEVLDLFAEQLPTIVAKLQRADSANAWFEAAHTLKGSARAVGANSIAELALQAEKLKDSRAEFDLQSLQSATDHVIAYIFERGANGLNHPAT